MKITKRQLRQIIREGLLREWAPKDENDRPRLFKDPSDMEITIEDIEVSPGKRQVIVTAVKDGVSLTSDPKFYQTKTSGDKQARMAYQEAVASARMKHNEDKV